MWVDDELMILFAVRLGKLLLFSGSKSNTVPLAESDRAAMWLALHCSKEVLRSSRV